MFTLLQDPMYIKGVMTSILFIGAVAGLWVLFKPADVESEACLTGGASRKVDPWMLQEELMRISGQHMPKRPSVNKGVLLYWALTLEELAETGAALCAPLARTQTFSGPDEIDSPEQYVFHILTNATGRMHAESVRLRKLLEQVSEFHIEPTRAEAVLILDGTSDICVVNCGLSLAAGMPGAAAYRATVESNLSKRNPETGRIDKTPDGKWIKGTRYQEPDLDEVLEDALHPPPPALVMAGLYAATPGH